MPDNLIDAMSNMRKQEALDRAKAVIDFSREYGVYS